MAVIAVKGLSANRHRYCTCAALLAISIYNYTVRKSFAHAFANCIAA